MFHTVEVPRSKSDNSLGLRYDFTVPSKQNTLKLLAKHCSADGWLAFTSNRCQFVFYTILEFMIESTSLAFKSFDQKVCFSIPFVYSLFVVSTRSRYYCTCNALVDKGVP